MNDELAPPLCSFLYECEARVDWLFIIHHSSFLIFGELYGVASGSDGNADFAACHRLGFISESARGTLGESGGRAGAKRSPGAAAQRQRAPRGDRGNRRRGFVTPGKPVRRGARTAARPGTSAGRSGGARSSSCARSKTGRSPRCGG